MRTSLEVGVLLLALVWLLYAAVYFLGVWEQMPLDQSAYFQAGRDLWAGEPLYRPYEAADWSQRRYLYPPAFAALFTPLALLPEGVGRALWMGLHFVFLGALLLACGRLAGVEGGLQWRRLLLVLAGTLLFAFELDFQEGQVNVLVAALLAWALAWLEERPVLAGVLLALAVNVKLQPIVLLPWLWVAGHRRAALWMVVAGPLWAAFPALVAADPRAALATNLDFVAAILLPGAGGDVSGREEFFVGNASLVATLLRAFSDAAFYADPALAFLRGPLLFALPRPLLVVGALVVTGTLYLGALLLGRRVGGSAMLAAGSAGLALTAAQLGSPTYWEHHFAVLALVVSPLVGLWLRGALSTPALCLVVGPLFAGHLLPRCLAWLAVQTPGDFGASWLQGIRIWGMNTGVVLLVWVGAFDVLWRAGPYSSSTPTRRSRSTSRPPAP